MVGGDNKDGKPEESGCGFIALGIIAGAAALGGIAAGTAAGAAARWKSTCSIF